MNSFKTFLTIIITSLFSISIALGATQKITSKKAFQNAVLTRSSKPAIVKCSAPWCRPCRAMQPIFERLSNKLSNEALFLELNTDKNRWAVTDYKISGIPTFLFFKDGKLVSKTTGSITEKALENKIKVKLNVT